MSLIQSNWQDKISHRSQLGGIETSIIDNGAAKGTRIAWINTGTGLRYKIVLDRGMDICEAFFNEYNLSWISHIGPTAPQPFSDKGIDWLRTFAGGMLTTCGLTHVGGPESDEHGERGLHGHIANTPAEIISIVQPDPLAGELNFSITGVMRESRPFGPSLELHRTISGKLGEAAISIHDKVVNRANTSAPHMLLYHFNFGFPLVDEGTQILWNGDWWTRNGDKNGTIFREGNDFKTVPAPLESHRGGGEEVAFIDLATDSDNNCTAGLYNPAIQLGIQLTFNKAELPTFTNWQHFGPNEFVTGLEPGNCYPIGQAAARKEGSLIFIEPGASKEYHIRLEITR